MRNARTLFVVLALALFVVGCGEAKKPAAITVPEVTKPPQGAGTTTTAAPATAIETAAVDLEGAGLPLVIDAPKGTTAQDDFGTVLAQKGESFQIEFRAGTVDFAARKKEIAENTLNKLKKYHTDAADTLLYETEVMGKAEFHFLAQFKVGDKSYYAEDVKGPSYTKADAESMLKSVRSARAK